MNSFTNGYPEGPTLSPHHWRRFQHNAIRHRRTGSVVVFHGPNATQHRNDCLKRLRRIPRPVHKKIKITKIDWMDE